MLSIESNGTLVFCVRLPGAQRVEVVGAFSGWRQQAYDMMLDPEGCWRLELRPAHVPSATPGSGGEFLFRYRIDGVHYVLENSTHGTRTTATGEEMTRVWLPPVSMGPGAIAA